MPFQIPKLSKTLEKFLNNHIDELLDNRSNRKSAILNRVKVKILLTILKCGIILYCIACTYRLGTRFLQIYRLLLSDFSLFISAKYEANVFSAVLLFQSIYLSYALYWMHPKRASLPCRVVREILYRKNYLYFVENRAEMGAKVATTAKLYLEYMEYFLLVSG